MKINLKNNVCIEKKKEKTERERMVYWQTNIIWNYFTLNLDKSKGIIYYYGSHNLQL